MSQAKRVVLAVGAWTNELLAHLGVQLDLEIWRMHWGYYRVHRPLTARFPQWYCFQAPGAHPWDGGLYYGFPIEGQESAIKVWT